MSPGTLGGWILVESISAGCGVDEGAYDYPTLPQVPVLTLVTQVTSASPSWTSCAPWVLEVSGEPCSISPGPVPLSLVAPQ